MKGIPFTKLQGTGNDFVVIDRIRGGRPIAKVDAVKICDRHFGVGADGVLTLMPSRKAAFRMHITNSDGSIAEMCGNGIRCAAKYVADRKLVSKFLDRGRVAEIREKAGFTVEGHARLYGFDVETGRGVLSCIVEPGKDGAVKSVWVDMGAPILERPLIPMTGDGVFQEGQVKALGRKFKASAVGMGNPHLVLFTDNGMEGAKKYGPALECSPLFPNRTNVEFAHMVYDREIEVVVWERGCGITLACGTGACATVVAHALAGKAPWGREVKVRLSGGTLGITVPRDLSAVFMRGEASEVFNGIWGEK